MKTRNILLALTVVAASLAAAGVALAHGGMGNDTPGMGHGMMGMGPGMGGMHGPEAAAALGARLAETKAQLKITPAQETSWSRFAALVTQQAEARDAMRTQMHALMSDPNTAATVDRTAQHEAMHNLQQANMTARDAALKDLYAVLTPEQKAVADQRLQGHRGHGMAGRAPAR